MAIKDFQDLDIWKRGIKTVTEIYELTANFPKQELYGLTAQLRRAAVSIPSNTAEGFARFSNKEYIQFLFVSLGSCAEATTQIIIALNLGYLSREEAEEIKNELNIISKMIMSLIKKLKSVSD